MGAATRTDGAKKEPRVATIEFQDKNSDPEDDWYYEYICAWCIAARDSCSLEVAVMTIHKCHHGWDRRMERANGFKFAKENVMAMFPGICG